MEAKSVNEVAKDSTTKSDKPRRKWLRRLFIGIGVIFGILLLAIAGVVIWLGPLTECVVEKYDKELVGRRLQLSNLRIKLFTATASRMSIIMRLFYHESAFRKSQKLQFLFNLQEQSLINNICTNRVIKASFRNSLF